MKKLYLGEREFLYAISVRFMKRFEDINSVDVNTKDVFMFKLDSGHTPAVNCKFDDLYSDYKKGLSIDTIFEKMLKCMNAETLKGKFIDAFASVAKKDNILKNVKLCPVDAKKITVNEHGCVFNGYETYTMSKCNITFIPKLYNNSNSQIPVTKGLCRSLGITKPELFNAAINNTSNSKYNFRSLKSMIEDLGIPCPDVPLYVITSNTVKSPALFISDKVMNDISKKVHDDYWIFPSSTEEFIVVPKSVLSVSDKEDITVLADIVRQANVEADVIKDGVFLSDNLYQYDRGKGFSIAEGNDYEQNNDIELD